VDSRECIYGYYELKNPSVLGSSWNLNLSAIHVTDHMWQSNGRIPNFSLSLSLLFVEGWRDATLKSHAQFPVLTVVCLRTEVFWIMMLCYWLRGSQNVEGSQFLQHIRPRKNIMVETCCPDQFFMPFLSQYV
jgi:hypothetical protein